MASAARAPIRFRGPAEEHDALVNAAIPIRGSAGSNHDAKWLFAREVREKARDQERVRFGKLCDNDVADFREVAEARFRDEIEPRIMIPGWLYVYMSASTVSGSAMAGSTMPSGYPKNVSP